MKDLAGKTAVITGAASGIGRALALGLAQQGCNLALADINQSGLEQTEKQVAPYAGSVSLHHCDVSKREALQHLHNAVLQSHNSVQLLINNAGVDVDGRFDEITDEDLDWILSINLWGVVHGCRAFLPTLKEQDEAHIVNISSLFGIIGVPGHAAYSTSKFAVRGLSEALSNELSQTNVNVTCVHPGGIQTDIVRNSRMLNENERQARVASFDRVARVSADTAASRIIRAIQRNQTRLRICPETYLLDFLKRLLPNATNRIVQRFFEQHEARL